jgi:hypothetical protein
MENPDNLSSAWETVDKNPFQKKRGNKPEGFIK